MKKLDGLYAVLLDTETTGIEEKDRVIEVGGMFVYPNGEMFITSELCNGNRIDAIPTEATEVHGIKTTELKVKSVGDYHHTHFAKTLEFFDKEAGKNIAEIGAGGVVIAHNIDFDLGMLKKEGIEIQNLAIIDTLRVAKHLYQDQGVSHRLQFLKHYLDLTPKIALAENLFGVSASAHSALGDVVVLSVFVDHLLSTYSVSDLIDMTLSPVELKHISFGKHKGKSFEQIAKEDIGYLEWLYKQEIDKDLEYTIEATLQRYG